MKLTYRRCGDYYLPNIGIPAEDMRPLGKYGRMRMRYLREHRSLLFNQLLLSGKLMKHLYSIDDACQERMDLLIPQMKAVEGVTEDLKAADPANESSRRRYRRLESCRPDGMGTPHEQYSQPDRRNAAQRADL